MILSLIFIADLKMSSRLKMIHRFRRFYKKEGKFLAEILFDYQLIHYPDKEITNWREAIAESCRVLIDKKIIDQTYVEEIIHCVEKYGPYIVIAPQVAMPHSSEKVREFWNGYFIYQVEAASPF